eukprot:scaffold32881_cov73-Skeletonema_dohrnii-CCMP3373.AAC.1
MAGSAPVLFWVSAERSYIRRVRISHMQGGPVSPPFTRHDGQLTSMYFPSRNCTGVPYDFEIVRGATYHDVVVNTNFTE